MTDIKSRWDGSDAEQSLMEYQPISIPAIVTLLLGLLSVGAVWVPGLSLFGFFAIAVAVMAAFSARVRPQSLVWLSYIGVFLAVAGTVWSLTGRSFYQNHVVSVAEKYGEQWLVMLSSGQVNEAICLRMAPNERPLAGIDLLEYFQRTERPAAASELVPPPAQMKAMFLESQTVRYLIESGTKTKITPISEKSRFDASQLGKAVVECFFNVEFYLTDSIGQKRWTSAEVSVILYRHSYFDGIQWQVHRLMNHTSPDPLTPGMTMPTGEAPAIDEDE